MNFLENITFRRTRTISEPINDTSEIISQTVDESTNSIPEISEDEEEDNKHNISILKTEIKNLRSQLKSAHQDMELLTVEISSLKQTNAVLLKENEIYKKVTSTPLQKKIQTPKRNTISFTNKKSSKPQTLEIPDCCAPTAEDPTENSQNKTSPNRIINKNNSSLSVVKNNICILSSETSNRLYTISQRTNLTNFDICHYRMPNCGLKQLLDNLDKKVQNFTYSDYCVIYVGEEDFRRTHNYIELVTFIREKLQTLTHTNFIVCLPTFKYMANKNLMFNSRIDTFNNLIYMDVETYKYAYILDSNLNLPYTYETYSQRYGSLNNKGLNTIINDLQDLILDLNTMNVDDACKQLTESDNTLNLMVNDNCNDNNFFRI